jgi:hypothetical protein
MCASASMSDIDDKLSQGTEEILATNNPNISFVDNFFCRGVRLEFELRALYLQSRFSSA